MSGVGSSISIVAANGKTFAASSQAEASKMRSHDRDCTHTHPPLATSLTCDLLSMFDSCSCLLSAAMAAGVRLNSSSGGSSRPTSN